MEFLKSKNTILLIIAVFALVLVGVFQMNESSQDEGDSGSELSEWRSNIQIDEDTRLLLEQRLKMLEASLAARESAGEEIHLDTYSFVAETAWYLGDLVTALKYYEIALDGNAINYVTWNNHGNVLKAMGDLEGALESYGQAMNLYPFEEYYRDYVLLYQQVFPEDTETVKEVLEMAVDEVGQTQWLMTALGDWYLADGDCDRAVSHYEVARGLEVVEEVKAEFDEMIAEAKQACAE